MSTPSFIAKTIARDANKFRCALSVAGKVEASD
jgi:hypothetical protein